MTALIVVLALVALVALVVAYACVVAGAQADRRSEDFDRKVALRVAGRSGSSGESVPPAAPPSARRVPPEGPSAA